MIPVLRNPLCKAAGAGGQEQGRGQSCQRAAQQCEGSHSLPILSYSLYSRAVMTN